MHDKVQIHTTQNAGKVKGGFERIYECMLLTSAYKVLAEPIIWWEK